MSIQSYINETKKILDKLDHEAIEGVIQGLRDVRARKGRVFVLGVGGSAANASHAVNDLRKLCGIDAYAPTDNVSELTARANDDGWYTTFVEYLKISRASKEDALLIFSVGGGTTKVSPNIFTVVDYAIRQGTIPVYGIVGPVGGITGEYADQCIRIKPEAHTTPHTEGITMVLLHLIVTELGNV